MSASASPGSSSACFPLRPDALEWLARLEGDDPRAVAARVAALDRSRAPSGLEVCVLRDGEEVLRRTFAQETVCIGRSPDNDLVIDAPAFSRYHAEVQRRGPAHYTLRDLMSQNGLALDGRRVAVLNLNEGDEVRVGAYALRFALGALDPDAAPTSSGSPEDRARAHALFGTTVQLAPAARDGRVRERSAGARAWLRPLGGAQPAAPIERDVSTLGAAADADLPLRAARAPAWAAVILRGPGGFRVRDVSPRGGAVQVGGEPVSGWAWLRNADTLEVCGQRFAFYVGEVPDALSAGEPSRGQATPRTAAPRRPAGGRAAAAPRAWPAWARHVALAAWALILVAFFITTAMRIAETF